MPSASAASSTSAGVSGSATRMTGAPDAPTRALRPLSPPGPRSRTWRQCTSTSRGRARDSSRLTAPGIDACTGSQPSARAARDRASHASPATPTHSTRGEGGASRVIGRTGPGAILMWCLRVCFPPSPPVPLTARYENQPHGEYSPWSDSRERWGIQDKDTHRPHTCAGASDAGDVHSGVHRLQLVAEGHVDGATRGRVIRGAAHLLRAEAGEEGRQHVGAEAPAEEADGLELRVDIRRDFHVGLGQEAPVQARRLVVDGVQAVVEEEEVDEAAGEAAAVVVLAPGVRVDVLDVVEEHDGPQREEGRNQEREGPDAQAARDAVQINRQPDERRVRAAPDDVLEDNLAEQGAVARARLLDEGLRRLLLPVRGDEGEEEGDEEVVLLRVAPGDGGV